MQMPSRTAIAFFALAGVCYFAACTGTAIALGFFGLLFEACMYVTLLDERQDKKDNDH
jgi:hypothetical protein